MSLAIFDLDNTLLAGDSDYLWGRFLVEKGAVDAQTYERANQAFYEQYKAGTLDIREFLRFALKPLADNETERLLAWRHEFMDTRIRAIILPAARQLVEKHRAQGHELLIITATNRFVTEPIAREFDVRHLLATEPEFRHGRYTGKVHRTPCFREGKVERLEEWLGKTGRTLRDSWFYSDSHNDIPLLERVTYPVAVDADAELLEYAQRKGWQRMSLR